MEFSSGSLVGELHPPRRRRAFIAIGLCLALLGAAGGIRAGTEDARARPGTGGDGKTKYFEIYSRIDFVDQHHFILNVATGNPSNGWVYGNRLHYQCAYWFLYQDGNPVVKVSYQRVNDAPYLKVNDKFGAQHPFQYGEECGDDDAEYEQNAKPAGLPSTTVTFKSGGSILNSLVFPSTSQYNSNVWFELDEQSPDEVTVEQYGGNATTGLIVITRLDPDIELDVSED
jgi:hypothetical protein